MEPGNGIPGGGLPAGAARKTSSNPKSYLILKDAEKVCEKEDVLFFALACFSSSPGACLITLNK
jgi:hypothetical protein